ncbi:MAG: ferredoxin [Chloroflexi bacterium]|nr:ferredoxin [Chloroflexota bacterium]
MKIRIDRDGCIECGACEAACPEVFVLKIGEPASVVEKYQTSGPAEGEVGEELSSCAREAAQSCPVDVISVE